MKRASHEGREGRKGKTHRGTVAGFAAVVASIQRREPIFANDRAEASAEDLCGDEVAGDYLATAANEGQAAEGKKDNWVMVSPYGDYPHQLGLQRFEKSDAVVVANEFKRLLNLPTRLIGLPWYVGHPDHPSFQDRDKDIRAYGRVKGLEPREDGLYAKVRWNDLGRGVIGAEMFSGHSPRWTMRPEIDAKGKKVFRPRSLTSIGFTNNPNIPVPTITSANEEGGRQKAEGDGDLTAENTKNTEKEGAAVAANEREKIIMKTIAKKLGLAEDASEEQINAAIAAREGAVTAANEAAAADKAKREKAELDFVNERKARAGLLIASAIASGKITAGEKGQWETDFVNDFAAAETRLGAAKQKVRTTASQAHSANLGARSAKSAEKQTLIQDFVNERMEKRGLDYATAYLECKAAHQDWFVAEG